MAYKISEDCISCGACEPECPNQAIGEGESTYVINAERCTECVGSYESSRCAEVCPVDACHADPARKEGKDVLLARWKKLHPGETPKA
ncbi:MAG: YfhL family 4Fe-4S dicluster ferredoxin [Dehalococcoidales bacterium]|nr:YfhL family 4Fe-4S dicluster ferredoxin [Dehalococcoidales bacterium]